jgi:hypothetical protein
MLTQIIEIIYAPLNLLFIFNFLLLTIVYLGFMEE